MDEQKKLETPDAVTHAAESFPVIGIGASAGGLTALTRLLEHLPPAPGMALVVVMHLAPDVPSVADRLLQRATPTPVLQVHDRVPLAPNQVYLMAPGHTLRVEGGALIADAAPPSAGAPATIDLFLRNLAEVAGERAIGIVLSGMGTDGVAGLACIKEHGGATIAQLPDEAEESGMPQAAIDSGMVDFVLPVAQVATRLVGMREALQAGRGAQDAPPPAPPGETLYAILGLLHAGTGHDFRHYKRACVMRRIARRMQVRAVPHLAAYLGLLRQDPPEQKALLQELLIGATGFFRDGDAFAALDQTVLPQLFEDRPPEQPFRAWVAACSSGEEAYSLAMLLAEHAGSGSGSGGGEAPQVFATDIDERAIAVARAGRYPQGIAADLAPQRLARFFTEEDGHYKVRKMLRDRILFARHDLLRDPPFSHLDLVTCRNFLIYLNRDVHRHVLEIFHGALRPGGYLFLGSAESADGAPDLFAMVDSRHGLYQAKPAAQAVRNVAPAPRPHGAGRHQAAAPGTTLAPAETRKPSLAELHMRTLARLAPPSLLVNAGGEIVHASDGAAAFLAYGGGEPSTQVLALVLPALRDGLRTALFQAQRSGNTAHAGPVRYERDGEVRAVDLTVAPVRDAGGEGLVLVRFDETAAASSIPTLDAAGADARVQALEQALRHSRRELEQTVEQADAWSVELGRANERLHATVDELRTYIEELESDRETLQSRNEELHTVNVELQARAEETAKAHDDLSNLVASTDIATLFLDRELRIQRYTPHVTRIVNVIPADVGRPLADITTRLEGSCLFDDVAAVFATLEPLERELRCQDGSEYIARIHPYRTGYDRVEGAVVTFFDISRRRTAERALEEGARRQAFLLALSDALRGETGADAIAERAVRMLAAEMGLDRCCIVSSWPDQDRAVVTHQAGNDRVAPLPAVFRPSGYPAALRAVRGQSLAIDDDAGSGQPGMRALVVATLRGADQRPAWSLAGVCAAPRHWTRGEVALVEEVAERAWSAIERARVEALAARAERRAENILEHMGDAHSVLDRNFVIVGVNGAAERLLGRERSTLLGRSHWDAFPGSVDAPVGLAFRRVVEEGIEQHLFHHYTGEGYDFYLEVDAYPTDEGGVAMFWRDVSERVQAELALRASEEKYRALFNEMDEAYAVVEVMADAGGRWTDFLFLEVNPAFMRHAGMPYPVGRTATQLLGTPNPRWAELYGRAAQSGEAIRLEEGEMTLGRIFDLNIFRLGGEGSRRVAVLFTDITGRKQAEAALADSERRYRLLFENMSEGFALAELIRDEAGRPVDWRYLEVNGAWAQTGVAPEDTVGRTAYEVNPAIEPYWIETYARVVDTGQPVDFEGWAAGFGKWFDTLAFKHSENCFGLLFRDVTGRHSADAALRLSETRYRALFESIDEGFVIAELLYDEEERVVDALYIEGNPAASRLTGVPDYTQRRFSTLMPGAELYWLEIYDRVARSGVAERHERYAGALGRWYDFHISRVANAGADEAADNAPRVAIVFQEITARKEAEEALRESEARFRALAEASPALIWQVDATGTLSYVNARCLEVTGTSLEQLRGLGWHGVVHPDDAGVYLDAVAWALRAQEPVQQRMRLRRAGGGHHWFESHALPWHAADGAFRGLVGMSIDIDEAVQAEEALKVADRRKDEFLATLAHELRNPLAPISNALQFLRYDGGRRRSDRLLAMVERQVRHMVRLVDDLMEVTRISRGKVDLRRAPAAQADILNSAVEISLPAFEQKRQQLTIEGLDGALRLEADKVRLTQVFANLLNNAAKYTGPEGRIWLGVRRDGREAVVTVRDTGMGIGKEQLPLIFEMFSQPHGRNGHTDSGLGIGLAMVRSLVALHGGRVEAHSGGPGQGSEFVVRLPLADCPDAALREERGAFAPGAAPLAGRRVLVVDDNRDAADSLCQLLAARGADTQAVYGGRAALEAVAAAPPDAIVLDIGMPEIDGYEVARRVRQDGRAERIRLVALSGWGQFADRERSAASGFDHHLTKPAEMDSLLRILAAP